MNKDELILKVAKKYEKELDLNKLVEAGNKGWETAEEKFDDSKGHKFETYALWWVRAAMIEAITGVSISQIAKIERLIGNE